MTCQLQSNRLRASSKTTPVWLKVNHGIKALLAVAANGAYVRIADMHTEKAVDGQCAVSQAGLGDVKAMRLKLPEDVRGSSRFPSATRLC